MVIRLALLAWGHRLCGADVLRLSCVGQCQGVSHSHGRWYSNEDPIFGATTGLLLQLAQLGHSSKSWSSPQSPWWRLQCSLPAHHLSREGHCASSSSRTFSGRCCHWPVSLVCPSAEWFGLERQEKTGNSEQSRDVVWSQMC